MFLYLWACHYSTCTLNDVYKGPQPQPIAFSIIFYLNETNCKSRDNLMEM